MTVGAAETPRIAVLTRWLEGGGAERVAINLVNAFVAKGFRVDLVLQYREGPYLRDLDDRVEVIVLNRRVRYGLRPLVRYLRHRRPVALLCLLTEPNVLGIMAWRAARLPGKVVVSEQTSLTKAHWTRRLAVRVMYRWADRVLACSADLAEELEALGVPGRVVTFVPNPVTDSAVAFVQASYPPRGRPLVVGAGRLDPQKDFETLIRAFARVRETLDAELCILGEGAARPRLEALLKRLCLDDHASLPGFVSPPWDTMARASVFVMSSRWEGWPNVLVEALGLGTPVVSTDCPTGPREILDDGRFGRLVPVGDVSAMARAIEETLDSPPEAEILRARSQEWTVARISERYLTELGIDDAAVSSIRSG